MAGKKTGVKQERLRTCPSAIVCVPILTMNMMYLFYFTWCFTCMLLVRQMRLLLLEKAKGKIVVVFQDHDVRPF